MRGVVNREGDIRFRQVVREGPEPHGKDNSALRRDREAVCGDVLARGRVVHLDHESARVSGDLEVAHFLAAGACSPPH